MPHLIIIQGASTNIRKRLPTFHRELGRTTNKFNPLPHIPTCRGWSAVRFFSCYIGVKSPTDRTEFLGKKGCISSPIFHSIKAKHPNIVRIWLNVPRIPAPNYLFPRGSTTTSLGPSLDIAVVVIKHKQQHFLFRRLPSALHSLPQHPQSAMQILVPMPLWLPSSFDLVSRPPSRQRQHFLDHCIQWRQESTHGACAFSYCWPSEGT